MAPLAPPSPPPMTHVLRQILSYVSNSSFCATMYDYTSDYKICLLNLKLLPLMYTLDYYDILKQPISDHFNILNSVTIVQDHQIASQIIL